MKIVIVGAGFTGTQLAKKLINEKNDVVLIDNDPATVEHLSNRLDCSVLALDGNNLSNLENAGIAKADALVAVTDNDEINMITCSLVDSVYPRLLKIARVRNYAYYVNTNDATRHHAETFAGNHRPLYGIDYMIHPDVEAAEAIVRAVEHGAVSDVVSFGNDEFQLTSLQVNKGSKIDGIALKNIRSLTDCHLIIAYVETKEGSSLPSGETILHAGDFVGVLTTTENMAKLVELFGTKMDTLKSICLVGAGRIGTIIAERMIQKSKSSFFKRLFGVGQNTIAQDFVIVDSDPLKTKEMSEKFPSARVFKGDITDEGLVREEGIDKFNLVICATHNHEMNMVMSAYLESLGVGKSVALVAHSAFAKIARQIGVDVAVPLQDAIVDSIMSHLRGKTVTGVHSVSNGNFEIVECDLPPTSKFTGKALKDIANPGEFLILLIKKPGSAKYELPSGNTALSAGDHLVLIQKSGNKKVLEKFSGIHQ